MDLRVPTTRIEREPAVGLIDGLGRGINYLRLSVTDRCNLRCFYCMGRDVTFLPRSEVLSIEEMERLAAAFVRLGITKLRLTGGEPLVRPGVMSLVERLGAWVGPGGLAELTMTTNGTLLAGHARALYAAGMRRVNVSLDTMDEWTFQRIAGHNGVAEVLAGIEAARGAGLAVRVNAVAMAGINDAEFNKLIRWCGEHDCDLALIEVMPLGMAAGHYLPLDVVRRNLMRDWSLTPLDDNTGGPGRYWRVDETGGRLAFITPMSHAFCAACNRVRVTCTGRLVLCLGERESIDLRGALRDCEADTRLEQEIRSATARKPPGHHFGERPGRPDTRPMWQLGG
ncbi:MAG TPA: GTP 3',8-cyclase MoaA [Rhodocyclaceae bacterium]|nr:GTP 3',8-cyclase MoaA [Rhodocyclaceae bacterium]